MWQRFSVQARRAVFLAQEEAGKLGEYLVSTEHILLGLIRDPGCDASLVLERLGASLESVRAEVERIVPHRDSVLTQEMQLTQSAKMAIDYSYEESRQLNASYVGTEHLLLGLIRQGEGIAGKVLNQFNIGIDRVRTEVSALAVTDEKRGDADSKQI